MFIKWIVNSLWVVSRSNHSEPNSNEPTFSRAARLNYSPHSDSKPNHVNSTRFLSFAFFYLLSGNKIVSFQLFEIDLLLTPLVNQIKLLSQTVWVYLNLKFWKVHFLSTITLCRKVMEVVNLELRGELLSMVWQLIALKSLKRLWVWGWFIRVINYVIYKL